MLFTYAKKSLKILATVSGTHGKCAYQKWFGIIIERLLIPPKPAHKNNLNFLHKN
jgi:hypothetical protein